MTGHGEGIYRLAARLRGLTLEDDILPTKVLEIAGRLDEIADAWSADEGDYAQALQRANAEIERLTGIRQRLLRPGAYRPPSELDAEHDAQAGRRHVPR